MNPRRPQVTRAHGELLRELFALERKGMFDQALHELRGIWDDITAQPNIDKRLGAAFRAEAILRCGALIGFLGSIRQIPTAQERSKNLLTEARSHFLKLADNEKIAACENYLALAYWRTGEINEAESWVEEALIRELDEGCDTRLYSYVIRDLVLLSGKRFKEVQANFVTLEPLFAEHADDFLRGSLYNNFGLAAKNLSNVQNALLALERARYHFARTGNQIQVALAENNLSQLYKLERLFDKAHESNERATELFKKIGDRTREGFSLDTKAQIHFDEGRFDEALDAAGRSIGILGTSENYAYLTEAIATKARIQLFANDFSTATLTLLEAVDLAKLRIGEDFALRLITEFEQALKTSEAVGSRTSRSGRSGLASGDLQLILPSSIAHYDNYQGVWISNADLEPYGLPRGSLAVVVPSDVRRGDLVALIETASDSVSCGFYDSDFGIVCLEAGGSEPQLFNQSDVKVLGKIVGVCDASGKANEPLKVRVLDL